MFNNRKIKNLEFEHQRLNRFNDRLVEQIRNLESYIFLLAHYLGLKFERSNELKVVTNTEKMSKMREDAQRIESCDHAWKKFANEPKDVDAECSKCGAWRKRKKK